MTFTLVLLALGSSFSDDPPAKDLCDRTSISREELFPPNLYLVRAEARKAKNWEIVHVYLGPPELKGMSIAGEYHPELLPDQQFTTPGFRLPVSLGAGVFWIRKAEMEKLGFARARAKQFRFEQSCLKQDWPYSTVIAAAEALGEIYGETDQGRLRRIDAHIRSENRIKSLAAIWQLTENYKDKRLLEYLRNLSNEPTLAIPIQVHVDLVLRLRMNDWSSSDAEAKMVERWLTAAWQEGGPTSLGSDKPSILDSDEGSLLAWMRSMVRTDHSFPHLRLLDFAVKARANPNRSRAFHDALVKEYRESVTVLWSPVERAEGAAYLAKAARDRQTLQEKVAAARFLSIFAPLNDEQTKQIRALLDSSPDEAVARELRALVKE
jgi:hypothetical protein